MYRNTPRILLLNRSPIGHGGMLLHVRGDPPYRLDGEYWTDRKTKGELTLIARCSEFAEDFGQAQTKTYMKPPEK